MIQKHIVVVDGAWAGHHPVYVRTFTRVLLEAGHKVTVLCPAPDEMTDWFTRNFSLEVNVFDAQYFSHRFVQLPQFIPWQFRSPLICLAHWFHIAKALKQAPFSVHKPDMIFFAWLDIYLNVNVPAWMIDWRMPFAWSGLYLHPRHHRDIQNLSVAKNRCALPEHLVAKSRFACSLAILDAGVENSIRADMCGKQVYIFPDFSDETPPCEDYHWAKVIKEKAKHRKIIGLLGSLERRKGVLTFLKLSQQPMDRDWFFVIAGELAERTFSDQELHEMQLYFNAPRENFFVFPGRIPDDAQFNALVNVCDAIFAVYEDFPHSSNLVTKAAAYGKYLLVSSGGYMEEVVRKYELGEIVPAGDVQAALASLRKFTAGGSAHGNSVGMQEYSMEQSQERLRKVLLRLVERCIGNAADSGMIK